MKIAEKTMLISICCISSKGIVNGMKKKQNKIKRKYKASQKILKL